MYFDIPDCRRCCLCIPLRHGVLIFGYIKLVFSTLALGMDLWLERERFYTVVLYRGVGMYVQVWLAYLLYLFEFCFNIVLVVGAHRKSTRTMRAYYYYGIVTSLATFLFFILIRTRERYSYADPFEFCLALVGLGLQGYLLLLIRAELNKLQYLAGPFRYVNHLAEVTTQPLPNGTTRDIGKEINENVTKENNVV